MSFLGFQIFKALVIEFISIILSVRNVKIGLVSRAPGNTAQKRKIPAKRVIAIITNVVEHWKLVRKKEKAIQCYNGNDINMLWKEKAIISAAS